VKSTGADDELHRAVSW